MPLNDNSVPITLIPLLLLLTLSSCNYHIDKNTETLTMPKKGFPAINARILQTRCVSCHSGSHGGSGIDLSSYDKLMKANVVMPFQPGESLLYTVLEEGNMPKGSPPLETELLALIKDWIMEGAPEVPGSPPVDPAPVDPVPVDPGPVEPKPPLPGTYQWAYQNVLSPKCIRCHGAVEPAADFDLSTYDVLMKSELVVPGDPANSYLVEVVASGMMPPGKKNDLTSDEIDFIKLWIVQGAKND